MSACGAIGSLEKLSTFKESQVEKGRFHDLTQSINAVDCKEWLSGDDTWNVLSMRIAWVEPETPGKSTFNTLDPLTFKLCLECKKPVPLRTVSAWAWTNMYHMGHSEGNFKEIKLNCVENSRHWNDVGLTTYQFSATIYPSHRDTYRLTFVVKFNNNIMWACPEENDHLLTITFAREVNEHTALPSTTHIANNIHIGNYLAVLLAEELGFDAVLNLDGKTQSHIDASSSKIIRVFKSTNLEIGAGNPIPQEKLESVVQWLREMTECNKKLKILVGDKEGRGRSGSTLVAYVFANNRNLTFEDALYFVRKRRLIYTHKGIKETLMNLYPRD